METEKRENRERDSARAGAVEERERELNSTLGSCETKTRVEDAAEKGLTGRGHSLLCLG